MAYTLPDWQNSPPSTATPLSAANLLMSNTAINDLDSRVFALAYPAAATVGSSIGIDASTPARVTSTTGPATTAAFNPPACILVAIVGGDTPTNTSATFTMSNNGTALTWNTIQQRNFADTGGLFGVCAAFYAVLSSARTGMTVTATFSITNDCTLKVYCLTGANMTAPLGGSAEGSIAADNVTTTGFTIAGNRSLGFIGAHDWNFNGAPTSFDATLDTYHVASQMSGASGYKSIADAGLAATFNINALGTTGAQWNWVAFEIKAAPNRPPQPGALAYNYPLGTTSAYAVPGALVIAGPATYADQAFKDISTGGGSVLVYLDAFIKQSGVLELETDRYGRLLKNASEFGPAVPLWPGMPQASSSGWLTDFRPYAGNVLQDKLPKVLELMVKENPHIAGWFFDDVGTRSFYPNIDWNTVSAQDKQDYRNGAIKICQTARALADKYKLIFIVNGTWSANDGGGYPDSTQHGCSLADGGFIENHTLDALWTAYASSAQWATESSITRGKSLMFSLNLSDSTAMNAYVTNNLVAYASAQADHNTVATPWGTFHYTGLPKQVTYP